MGPMAAMEATRPSRTRKDTPKMTPEDPENGPQKCLGRVFWDPKNSIEKEVLKKNKKKAKCEEFY